MCVFLIEELVNLWLLAKEIMDGYLFDQHEREIIQHMWLKIFEACITTNSYPAELQTEAEEKKTCFSTVTTRHQQIKMALRYFSKKYQPLHQIIEKVAFCGFSREGKLVYDNKHKTLGDNFSGENERKKMSDFPHLDYLHMDLSSNINGGGNSSSRSNNHNFESVYNDKKLNQSLFSKTIDSVPLVMLSIMTTQQEKKP